MSIKEDENFAKALEAFYRKRGYSDLERVREALEAYFPRAIAEAVAAEREKNAKICEAQRLNEISAPADWHNDACKACAEAIRSAAK